MPWIGSASGGGLVKGASTDAFHLAMLVGAALLLVGALVNAIGIRNPRHAASAETAPAGAPTAAKEPA